MSDDVLIHTFVEEAREYIDEAEPSLIELRQASAASGAVDSEILDRIFRLFHSMKGSAGFLQLDTIGAVTHEAETVLDHFRNGRLSISEDSVTLLCRALDLLAVILEHTDEHLNDEGFSAEAGEIIDALAAVSAGAGGPTATADDELMITDEMRQHFMGEAEELLETAEQSFLAIEDCGKAAPDLIEEAFRALHSLKGNCGFMGLVDLERLSHRTEETLGALRDGRIKCSPEAVDLWLRIVDALREAVGELSAGGGGMVADCDGLIAELMKIHPGVENPADLPADPVEEAVSQTTELRRRQRARRDIRVDLEKLDALINLVGELVTAEAMVTRNQDLEGLELENFERATHQLRRVVNELQDVAMAVRMVPVAATFRKLIRVVHDLSMRAGKTVHLEIRGEETEIDKTVIEQISDPLVHIIRNAVDHGIETPAERRAAGKAETGRITVEARHEAGEVWILISDDGRGLDRDKIIARALDNGLLDAEPTDWRDERVFQLAFEPGFSTADEITDISGRGVGLDVVKQNIESLNGRIRIRSEKGVGTTIILRIPLTLAVIEGMLVRVGESRYTIPMLSIRESFRPQADWVTLTPDGQEVVSLREDLIPVLRLYEVFDVEPRSKELDRGILLVVEDGDEQVCLYVDDILGQHQAVIKGLTRQFGSARGIAGCSVLGDGDVSLILDIGSILAMAGTGPAARFNDKESNNGIA